MSKFPNSVICPNCKSELSLDKDGIGALRTDKIITMRVKSPLYVHMGKTAEIPLDVSVCSKCNTIIGINRKGI